jgi:hypothetical protein
MDNKLSNVWVPRDLIVRDASNTKKVTARAGLFSVSRQVKNRKTRCVASVRRCVVNGKVDCVSDSSLLLFRVLVLCVSLSLCVSVSRSRGKCPASDGLKRAERGESHGSERERAFLRLCSRSRHSLLFRVLVLCVSLSLFYGERGITWE